MKNLKIRDKIILAFLLGIMPLMYLLYTLISNQNVLVNFTKAEMGGNAYIRVLLEDQQIAYAALRSKEWGSSTPNTKTLVSDIAILDTRYGAAFLANENAAKLQQAMTSDITSADTFSALRDVIARVADKSNLMLDPDLDSYYLMDGVVVRIPMLMDQVRTIAEIGFKGTNGSILADADRINLYVARGSLETTRGDVDLSFTTASNNGRDENVKANLIPTYDKLKVALADFSALSLQIAEGKSVSFDTYKDAEKNVISALGAMANVGSPELNRMLQNRLDGYAHDRLVQVSISLVLFALSVLVVFSILNRGVVKPLAKIAGVMDLLSHNKLDVAVPYEDKHDEVGVMARAVSVFKTNAIERQKLQAAEQMAAEMDKQRQIALESRLKDFEHSIQSILNALDESAASMIAASETMTGAANNTADQSQHVASSTRRTTENIQGIAAAVAELSATTDDISTRATRSASIADQAFEAAKQTETAVTELSELAVLINTVVETIDTIASQTNLLALNATIEAARAGEAGKGFAVVAGEVKVLSGETTNATGEIADKVQKIQTAVNHAHDKVERIVAVITELTEAASAIQHNVEQQGAATSEISHSLQQVSTGAQEITFSIEQVSQDATRAADTSRNVASVSESLVEQSERIGSELKQFFKDVRNLTQAA